MRHPDIRICVVLLAVFAVLFGYSFFLPSPPRLVGVGPAFVPQLVLVALMGLTLLLLVQSWHETRRSPAARSEREPGRGHLYGMLVAVGFVLMMSYVGTFVSVALYVAVTVVMGGGRRFTTVIVMALAVPVAVYLLFTKLLEVQFPAEWMF